MFELISLQTHQCKAHAYALALIQGALRLRHPHLCTALAPPPRLEGSEAHTAEVGGDGHVEANLVGLVDHRAKALPQRARARPQHASRWLPTRYLPSSTVVSHRNLEVYFNFTEGLWATTIVIE